MRQSRIPAREFYTRPDLLVPAELELQREYGFDVATITFDVYNIEAEGLGAKLMFSDDFVPDVDRSVPLVRDREDLARLRTPDFDTAGRFTQIIEMHSLFRRLTGLEPTLNVTAPFSLAANLRGMEQLIYDIHADPSFARSLFDRLVEDVLAPWIAYQRRIFPHSPVRGVDATASLPLVNLPILRDWAAHYIRRLREEFEPTFYVSNWVGEAYLRQPAQMLDLKLQAHPGCLYGQDPDVEKLGPEVYRAYADAQGAALVLGIGARFLAAATPAEVAERVRYYVSEGGPRGRFALYLCNVGGTTSPENLRAAIETAHACEHVAG